MQKAAVLAVHITRNHPFPDGNKRVAWGCLRMFVALNGRRLEATDDDAVDQMVAVAAGEVDDAAMERWLSGRIE